MSQQPPQYPPTSPPPGGTPPGGVPPGGWSPGSGGDDGGPPKRSKAPLVVGLVIVAALLVGGGALLLTRDDGYTEEEERYIDALTEASMASEDEDDLELDEDGARCLSAAVVDTVGIDVLRDTATPEEIRENPDEDSLSAIDLDLEQAREFYVGVGDCIDWREVFLDDIEAGGRLSSEQIDCIDRSISDDLLQDLLVAGFAEDEDASAEANRAADEATEDCDLPS